MKKIYLITPNILNAKFYSYLPKVLATNKINILQLRCKSYSKVKIEKHLKKILPLTKKYKVKLIINDHSSFSESYKNIGFHLGQKDLVKKNNQSKLKKNNFFGITCHNSIILAKKALKFYPNYIAFGAFFPTKTKRAKYKSNIKTLNKARILTNIPIVAIGGITNKNYKKLLLNNANFLAISGYIWNNKKYKPTEAIESLI